MNDLRKRAEEQNPNFPEKGKGNIIDDLTYQKLKCRNNRNCVLFFLFWSVGVGIPILVVIYFVHHYFGWWSFIGFVPGLVSALLNWNDTSTYT